MINRVEKGRRNELRAAKIFEKQGFMVEKVVRTKFKPTQDFFSLFDLIGVREISKGKPYKVFVQVKSNTCPGKVKRKIKEWAGRFLLQDGSDEAMIVIFHDRGKEEVISFSGAGV